MEEQTTFSDFVGRGLYDLSYYQNYPLNPGVIKGCFLDSIKCMGGEIVFNDRTKEAVIITLTNLNKGKPIKPDFFDILSVFKYEELGKSRRYPNNSIKAFEDLVYNLWQPEGNLSENEARILRKVGDEMTDLFNDVMKSYLLLYLIKHQEHMLIPASGEVPKLDKPKIAPYLVSTHRKNIQPGIKFWALYLDRLCGEKGYPLKEKPESDKQRLEKLVNEGNFALQEGSKIWKVVY